MNQCRNKMHFVIHSCSFAVVPTEGKLPPSVFCPGSSVITAGESHWEFTAYGRDILVPQMDFW